VRGARVDDRGTVLDPSAIPISTAPDGQQHPTVAANGPFLVTWLDRRNGLVDSRAVFAALVDPDGAVAHAEGFVVVPSIGDHHGPGAPVTAAPGEANFTVAYERLRAGEPYGSTRAALRRIAPK
jgi:hypothetical protein